MATDTPAGAPPAPEPPSEKTGLRNAWGRVAETYDDLWVERTAHLVERALDLLDPDPGWDGLDVGCGPGYTTRQLARRLPRGRTLGVDFAEGMVARAGERYAAPGLDFAVDDAERLSLPSGAYGAVTCSFGLMYCYEPHSAVQHMARVVRPGGRLAVVVWGRASDVWWSPVIELVESRAAYYVSVCPMMFFYGLPGVLARMLADPGLEVLHDELIRGPMRFPSPEVAVEAAILGTAVAGLYRHRLDTGQQAEVRAAMLAHVLAVAERDGDDILVPAHARIAVAQKA